MKPKTFKRKTRKAFALFFVVVGVLAIPVVIGIPLLILGIICLRQLDDDRFFLWQYGGNIVPNALCSAGGRKPFPCIHITGLDLIDGAPVTVEINEGSKSYIFRAPDGFKFVLPKSQITDVRRENNDVIEVIEKPSIGYAALGYIGFGIPGLLLGSLATKQEERILQMDRALVFDYIDNCGVPAQIRCGYLDDKGCNFDWWTISAFEKDYSKHRDEYAI